MPASIFARHYSTLSAAARPARDDAEAFDNHVLASILAAALTEEATSGIGAIDGLGLSQTELDRLVCHCFPSYAATELAGFEPGEPAEEEALLVDLLLAHRSGPEPVATWLATLIARRAMRPDHLWQDLGLNDRGELNRLLARHFQTLHTGNTGNMRWKKYFYRVLCEAEGFSLCAAPSCAVCTDFNDCFGAEDGLSRLADLRRRVEQAA
ncbi:nitrogen fixation protein NifQ [Pleomorphomonas sp. JP5]|uniref:nitrogen fixation protein NifQ n=1 Tax=Pleomorphomonas sp. JP5 TaxID=2942998 RepID=UPI00204440E0|nr:nitrogen fixation protein NifQ [Pleomorphomonas sp. JP5]MCM5558246.1 nitrogen fixation protein NifQ [Pleomorphomonas sp. JP5]